jgi:hypothetical protein
VCVCEHVCACACVCVLIVYVCGFNGPCNGHAKYSGLCTVRCTVRYAFYCIYRDFVNYGAITLLEDLDLP